MVLIVDGGRSRNDRADRRDDVCRDVHGRDEPGIARFAVAGRSWRNSFRRYPHVGANGTARRLHGSRAIQGGRGPAANAGAHRVGQRRNGRARSRQWPAKNALPARTPTPILFSR